MANDFLFDRFRMLTAKQQLTLPQLWTKEPFCTFSAEAEPIDPEVGHVLQNWCGAFALPDQFVNPDIGKPDDWLNAEDGKILIRNMFQGPYPPADDMQFNGTTAYTGCIFKLTFGSAIENSISRHLCQVYGPCGSDSIFKH